MSTDLRDIRPPTAYVLGALFFLVGLAIALVSVDVIQVDPASIHAPRWVLGVAGGMFGVSGLGILYYGVLNGLGRGGAENPGETTEAFPNVAWLVGLAIAGGLTAIASWIAFGPGERVFSGSIGIGGIGVDGSDQSETVGRWVFGIGAVLSGLFTLWGLIYGVRESVRRFRR